MDYFELMAECSVAVGGFSAVHAVLRGSTRPRGAYRAWGAVTYGFTAFLMALAPLLVGAGGILDADGWRLASGLGLVPCVVSMWGSAFWDHRLSRAGFPAQVSWILRVNQGLIAVAAVGLLGNLAGWPWTPSWTHYAVPVTLVLLSGVIAISISFWLAIGHSIDETSDEP